MKRKSQPSVAGVSAWARGSSLVLQVALVHTPVQQKQHQQQPVGAVADNYMGRSSRSLSLQLGMRLHSCRFLVLASRSRHRRGKKVSSAVVVLVLSPLLAEEEVCSLDRTFCSKEETKARGNGFVDDMLSKSGRTQSDSF